MTDRAIDTVCWFLFGEKDESFRQPLMRKMFRFLIKTFNQDKPTLNAHKIRMR